MPEGHYEVSVPTPNSPTDRAYESPIPIWKILPKPRFHLEKHLQTFYFPFASILWPFVKHLPFLSPFFTFYIRIVISSCLPTASTPCLLHVNSLFQLTFRKYPLPFAKETPLISYLPFAKFPQPFARGFLFLKMLTCYKYPLPFVGQNHFTQAFFLTFFWGVSHCLLDEKSFPSSRVFLTFH